MRTGRSGPRISPATATTRRTRTRSIVEIGLFREPKASKRKEGAIYLAGPGGARPTSCRPADVDENLAYVGYPAEMIGGWQTWTAQQQDWSAAGRFMVSAATLFPNLSFVHNWPRERRGPDRPVHLGAAVAAGRPERRPRCCPGSWSTRRRPRGSSGTPTGPTCCASVPPACSSRTTWRTGPRSPCGRAVPWPSGCT